jgi:hypothetical protein
MKRLAMWVLLLAAASPSWGLTLWGVDINGLEVQSSWWSVQNAVGDGAPNPVVNTLGVSIPFRFLGHWTARPEVQFFTLGYKFQDGRAVPESAEWDNVTILGVMINPTAGYEFTLSPTLSWAAEGGFGFLARFPIFFNGSTASDMALPATGWLLAGRFLYPNVGSSITWQFSPLFAATLRGQLFYPIFNLWNGLPWYDELTYGIGIGIRFTF